MATGEPTYHAPAVPFILAVGLPALIVFEIVAIVSPSAHIDRGVLMLFVLGTTVALPLLTVYPVTEITLEGNTLVAKSIWRSRHVDLADIESFSVRGNGKNKTGVIRLVDHRELKVTIQFLDFAFLTFGEDVARRAPHIVVYRN